MNDITFLQSGLIILFLIFSFAVFIYRKEIQKQIRSNWWYINRKVIGVIIFIFCFILFAGNLVLTWIETIAQK